jgi:proline iminopeptidase
MARIYQPMFQAHNPNGVFMQHSEFGITGNATLKNWDVKARLKTLTVPTLSIGSKYDTMDPEHMKWIANEVQNGRFFVFSNGSLSSHDPSIFRGDQVLKDVDSVGNPERKFF